ncbi:cyclin-like protein [Epithele typhae]|uniref:cyclin-like protein n=1 Tax=Epithele typhae TaxID=378194 RepID=UPI0020080417|nr:cyclin-like protein [Epithele typhae]KAH9924278.1 cyclin-like protein [Epithele typhae]
MDHRGGDPPDLIPASYQKFHQPYFTPKEVEMLSERQRGKLSIAQEERARQDACRFIEAIGLEIGFPRKTIATAQNLYHRFHLFFPRHMKDIQYYDVCLAVLLVSCKIHDTLKKTRDLLLAAHGVRNPDRAARAKAMGGEIDVDPMELDGNRQRLLAVERLVVETICYNFNTRVPFSYIIKMARGISTPKRLAKLAYRLAVDSFRTLINLSYPPHTVALGCIYLASLLDSFEHEDERDSSSSHRLAYDLVDSNWPRSYQVHIGDIEEIAHGLIDLLIATAQAYSQQYPGTANPSANTSPHTPSSPSPHIAVSGRAPPPAAVAPPVPWKVDFLMRLKIHMRETEHQGRLRESSAGDLSSNLIGTHDKPVRFMFAPQVWMDDP